MRTSWMAVSTLLVVVVWANGPQGVLAQTGHPWGCVQDGMVDPCADGDCWSCGRRGSRYEGREPGFNCGCNGSYKFPVPPLYTYHWPGMYSSQLMTDYHSPWRFPPLKPYVDEAPPEVMGIRPHALRPIQPTSATTPTKTAQPSVKMSTHLESILR